MSTKSAAVATWFLLASLVTAEDWATYQGDNRRNAKTAETLDVNALSQVWRWHSPHPPQPAWSGPAKWDAYAGIRGLKSMRNYDPVFHTIAVGDRVFFGSSVDDGLHCLDAHNGKEMWCFTTDGPIRVAPSYWKGKVYFGSDDGHVYCLEAATGKEVWRFHPARHFFANAKQQFPDQVVNNGRLIPFWPCRSGVAIEGGIAYFTASLLPWKSSFLGAVDAATGKLTSKGCYLRRIQNQTMEGPLLTSPERIVVPQGRVAPQLFQRQNGKSLGGLKGGGGSFVLLTADDRVLHGPGNKTGWITSSKASSRERIATFKRGNAIIVDGSVSYMLTDAELIASDFVRRKVLWQTDCEFPLAMIMAGRTLFVGGTDKVGGFDVKTGKKVWEAEVDGHAYGLSVANGRLFASTDTGDVYAFGKSVPGKPSTGKSTVAETKGSSSDAAGSEPRKLKAIDLRKSPGLIGRWVFQSPHVQSNRVVDLAGSQAIRMPNKPRLTAAGPYQALVLDGQQRLIVADDIKKTRMPKRLLTATAWVRLDKTSEWGGIVGAIQDNGSYERGWLLGSRKQSFSFALCGKKGQPRLTYLTAPQPMKLSGWHHVAGTYDGTKMRLYVDGRQVATSDQQVGDIYYPPKATYELARYHDDDEDFPLHGQIHEVRVYDRVLSDGEIQKQFVSKRLTAAATLELAAGPILRFDSPSSAIVSWESKIATASSLSLQTPDGSIRSFIDKRPRTVHRMRLTGLKRNRTYQFLIHGGKAGSRTTTKPYECDTFFNYARPTAQGLSRDLVESSPVQARLAKTIVERTKVRRGLCVVLGCKDINLALELARASQLRVIAVSTRPAEVRQAREWLRRAKVYGSHVSVRLVDNLGRLPFTRCFANLVVSKVPGLDAREVVRILRPDGGKAVLLGRTEAEQTALRSSGWSQVKAGAQSWLARTREALPGAGQWSHLYGTADNSAFGGESLQDASSVGDLEVQWVGRPGARYQPDRNGRKPSPLSTSGRLFLQGLQRIVCLDSFNGTVLWSLELPELGRFNMPRDCSNWCADRSHVFVAIKERCLQIDAKNGRIVKEFAVAAKAAGQDWGYIGRVGDRLIGSEVAEGTAFKSFWGSANQGWYDAKSGDATAKVCSERIFARDVVGDKSDWQYRNGLIINATITVTGGRVHFVESRNPALKAKSNRRFADAGLWKDRYLVALDLKTGRRIWERPISTPAGTVVYYMAAAKGKLVLTASSDKKYHIDVFDADNGKPAWNTNFPWLSDNHGGHMSRPAIIQDSLYVRPRAFELKSGKALSVRMPGGGCGTYAATKNALFFRSSNVTVWDRNRGSATKWNRLRPDCWLSTIPAGGMLLSPEGGGGCSCGSWMETSIGFIPKMRGGKKAGK